MFVRLKSDQIRLSHSWREKRLWDICFLVSLCSINFITVGETFVDLFSWNFDCLVLFVCLFFYFYWSQCWKVVVFLILARNNVFSFLYFHLFVFLLKPMTEAMPWSGYSFWEETLGKSLTILFALTHATMQIMMRMMMTIVTNDDDDDWESLSDWPHSFHHHANHDHNKIYVELDNISVHACLWNCTAWSSSYKYFDGVSCKKIQRSIKRPVAHLARASF